MRRLVALLSLLSITCLACQRRDGAAVAADHTPKGSARPFERVVVVSIDGLRPIDCARTETLRKLSAEGAFAAPPEGVLGVTPSVTYPSHTSMVTGVYPDKHGIMTNLAGGRKSDGGWRWYREDVRVDTVYELAERRGLRTALISWPVTVGASATVRMPEYWRSGNADDVKLVRALSTPGFLAEVEKRDPKFLRLFTPPEVVDRPLMSAALTALELAKPELLLVHMFGLDSAEHKHGPGSEGAHRALMDADEQLARMLTALERSPDWQRSALVVVSDHGFIAIDRQVLLKVHLQEAELEHRVEVLSGGGFAYFYLTSAEDDEAARLTFNLFEKLRADPAQGIAKVLDRQAIAAQHGDPTAFMALEAKPGFGFSKQSGPTPLTDADGRGTHGYLPERPEMRASLIIYGPRIAAQTLKGARLVDLAPTLAEMLGFTMPNVDGRALTLRLR